MKTLCVQDSKTINFADCMSRIKRVLEDRCTNECDGDNVILAYNIFFLVLCIDGNIFIYYIPPLLHTQDSLDLTPVLQMTMTHIQAERVLSINEIYF